jgi:acetylglutamate kinase
LDLFKKYVLEGIVSGGMIPKLENSFDALKAGVKQVVITRSDQIHLDAGTTMLL